jgi:vancomycin resistance protein VanJ
MEPFTRRAAPADTEGGPPPGPRRIARALVRPGPWQRGLVLAVLAVLLGLVLLLHAAIPDAVLNAGSLLETFLPWLGLLIPVLLAGALLRRSASAAVALLLPALAWVNLFGGTLSDKSDPGGGLTVISENVNAGNPDPAATARGLAGSAAGVVALEELAPQAVPAYARGLARAYPHHVVLGTVGLWSKWPLSHVEPVDIDLDTPGRALRATVATGHGPLTVYVAHLWSVRVNPKAGFSSLERDDNEQALAQAIADDPAKRVVLFGDLNGTLGDRAFRGLDAELASAQAVAGSGFGFTWPAAFPVVRIDQIMVRGVRPDRSWVLPANGSDHRPVAATLSW